MRYLKALLITVLVVLVITLVLYSRGILVPNPPFILVAAAGLFASAAAIPDSRLTRG